MAMATGAERGRRRRRRRRLGAEDEGEELVDRISHLPDGILGDIVSFLPSKDGARTQVLSSRWRPIWRSAPLNLDLIGPDFTGKRLNAGDVSRILSAHQGPVRRFCTRDMYYGNGSAALDGWLQSSALDKLQELKFHRGISSQHPPPQLPASVDRFSSTLRAASIGGCSFPEGNGVSPLQLPLLKQLSLLDVRISETSLYALLASCPALQSLLLADIKGCSRVQIVSPNLRSMGLRHGFSDTDLQELIIEDAPCLERLICFEKYYSMKTTVSVISAPKLHVFAPLGDHDIGEAVGSVTFQFGSTVLQRFGILSLTMVVHSVKFLALTWWDLCLDMVINFLKCFPCLEKLYIKTPGGSREKNTWCRKYKNLIGTIEIRLKKIVLAHYRGNASHVNFTKFFVLNARMLQSMRLELHGNPGSAWIERQHGLLQIKNKASRDAQFDFVASNRPLWAFDAFAEQVHDLSTTDLDMIPYNNHRNPFS
ncbi:unnamed protein product [Urochloa decumbens]|uniref:FBD domain-containing protein n=1 Tax=Urochloa decumbens TaxID=240449 RepID=A0ABC9GZR5_9POAL